MGDRVNKPPEIIMDKESKILLFESFSLSYFCFSHERFIEELALLNLSQIILYRTCIRFCWGYYTSTKVG